MVGIDEQNTVVELIKGFVVNYELLLNVNLIVGTTFLIDGHGLNYNKSESHLSLNLKASYDG